jgi:4-alpha-glucanotransferase
MKFERASGILLHPTSLPGPFGIGDIGPQAMQWINFLSKAGCSLWQMLPLGPTGYGDSPYQCFSAFAGNTYLISPDALLEDNLLVSSDLEDFPICPVERVDFGVVIQAKIRLLNKAYQHFKGEAGGCFLADFEQFCSDQADWLDEYALFMALKDAHNGEPWTKWDASLRTMKSERIKAARKELEDETRRHAFWQYLFYKQWIKLKVYAQERNISLVGDVPIFVAHDSADVWANQALFYLDRTGQPSVQSGVPPDYFSPTGQLWGNPIYRWPVHKSSGFRWWIARLKKVLELVDIVRLDHFRGFCGYWEVPGKAATAEKGRWRNAPGKDFLTSLKNELGDLPIIAEDLGVITPDVVALREEFDLPGMKILQFAFGDSPTNPFLPHNYPCDCVAYTGTHDNDTALGWYQRVPENEKGFYRRYLDRDGSQVSWDLIRSVWSSTASYAVAPLQDFLELGNEARMNYPGNPSGNWTWRLLPEQLSNGLAERISELNYLYDRKNTFCG